MNPAMILTALDGSNPLAFLAAIGTLRLLHLHDPNGPYTLRWIRQGVWNPELCGVTEREDELCERLHRVSKENLPAETFVAVLGKNITVDQKTFAEFVRTAFECVGSRDRAMADFAAALGSEICKQERKDRIEYTDLCFITGSGHQHFLGTMAALNENVTPQHIYDALFGVWNKSKGFSMRWDPADAAEYAFRWSDPSQEGASSVWGANLLGIHALPLFPSQPTETGLQTTGFRSGARGEWPEFSWPIWTHSVGLDTVSSLLSMADLQQPETDIDHRRLKAFGIEEVYRAPRVRIGQGANFKVSFRPARAV
ncbi:MAG: hypothetical protein JO138_08175 [Acidobacteriaceae bacterium]|nr:hypothetical protein [Acidobacteriaceae bacterium]